MCQNSAVYSLHTQTGTKWPVSGLDLGIRFVEKLCDSDVDTHIIDVHPQKNIYVLYIIHMHIHVTQHPNYLGNLQQSWDDCDYEFMTMITTTIRMFLHRLSTTISATMINLNCHYDYYNILQY